MAAVDRLRTSSRDWSTPAEHAAVVSPSDTVDLAYITHALYVGAGGDVAVEMHGGEKVTFKAVPTGTVLPIRVQRVEASGTTASLMLALS